MLNHDLSYSSGESLASSYNNGKLGSASQEGYFSDIDLDSATGSSSSNSTDLGVESSAHSSMGDTSTLKR